MSRFGNLEFDHEPNQDAEVRSLPGQKDAAFYLREAQTAFENAWFEPALRLYARALEHDPQNLTAWTGQVRALIELGEFREARVWADKALERFPTAPELLAAKAVALGRDGDVDAAMAFSDASLEERGDAPYLWLARGDVLLARKERRADHCFERALELAPGDWFIAWLAARIRHFYRQFAAALKMARLAAQWNPGAFTAWLICGQCQAALGLAEPARTSFEQTLQLSSDCRAAREALTDLQHRGPVSRLGDWFRRLFSK
jgi:tetratricopeptide (TPR) repeat protein